MYLKREGVTRDGQDANMFDARTDETDSKAFAERCEGDRHHFRFTVSPEDAAEMTDLRAFTRELMSDVECDLGTKLDWIAVDHWNTDNPHIHILLRGRADDGHDLVISRAYISHGLRDRAAERVMLELGPRSEQAIRSALDREVGAERWTNLDRALRALADEGAGIVNLRPDGRSEDPELRRLLVGRAGKLERFGLAEQVAPGCWTLKPGIEETLREVGIRGDIIKTMHRAMTGAGREPDISGFALHGGTPAILGYAGSLAELIVAGARASWACGCDGIIAAPQDNPNAIRRAADADGLLVVTPGVRLAGAALDDHKRSGTPAQAIADGADYLVVGRPIVKSPDPAAAALQIVADMRRAAGRSQPDAVMGQAPRR